VGAGVRDFTIYVSDNGGSFYSVPNEFDYDLRDITGQDGHTYGFYTSRAIW